MVGLGVTALVALLHYLVIAFLVFGVYSTWRDVREIKTLLAEIRRDLAGRGGQPGL